MEGDVLFVFWNMHSSLLHSFVYTAGACAIMQRSPHL